MSERRTTPDTTRTTGRTDDKPGPGLDQAPVSAERAHEVADRAETAATRPISSDRTARVLNTGDNFQSAIVNDGGSASGAGDARQPGEAAADRYKRIAERAYYKAERRGFDGGFEDADWLEAEREESELESRGRRS